MGDFVDAKGMLAAIVNCRDDPTFQKGVGHKRNALVVCIAVMVHIVAKKGMRVLTPNMQKMMDITFPEAFINTFLQHISAANMVEIEWKKDGIIKRFKIDPLVSSIDVEWSKVPWAAVRV
jgi:hypothetical protein